MYAEIPSGEIKFQYKLEEIKARDVSVFIPRPFCLFGNATVTSNESNMLLSKGN